jgi:hypothetical protein
MLYLLHLLHFHMTSHHIVLVHLFTLIVSLLLYLLLIILLTAAPDELLFVLYHQLQRVI